MNSRKPADRQPTGGEMSEIEVPLLLEARRVRREFLVTMEPHRPRLFAYCRRLTGNVWDAEDLVQESLAKAFARAAEEHNPVDNPLGWLIRVATNAYIDGQRRARPALGFDVDRVAPEQADPVEVEDALAQLFALLPPQERAAVVLKDVFDFSLAEIASMVGSSVGAVKSALHRGRGALAADDREERAMRRPSPDPTVLRAAAEAFTAYDVEALLAVVSDDGVMDLVGMVYETGPQQMREGTLHHTFDLEDDVRYTADVREFDGEPVVAIWSAPADSSAAGSSSDGPAQLAEVWRCETVDGRLTRIRDYFFCPEVVTEIAAAWSAPTALHGYRYA
jgi:RNA polymerase sigma-70 factor, ECF subfamily